MADDVQRGDYYRILHVDPAAHPEVVRAAYRTLLRVLGKHPDLGGQHTEATSIIEAYRTLSDTRRRLVYDQWRRAHSPRPAVPDIVRVAEPRPAPVPAPRAGPAESLPPGVLNWIRDTLGEFRLAPRARFARAFDVVFERPSLFSPRLYVKAAGALVRSDWPTLFVLGQALRVAREGWQPSLDVILVVTRHAEEPEAFLAEARRHAEHWAWNRTVIALCTLAPPRLGHSGAFPVPRMLRRLRVALPRSADGARA